MLLNDNCLIELNNFVYWSKLLKSIRRSRDIYMSKARRLYPPGSVNHWRFVAIRMPKVFGDKDYYLTVSERWPYKRRMNLWQNIAMEQLTNASAEFASRSMMVIFGFKCIRRSIVIFGPNCTPWKLETQGTTDSPPQDHSYSADFTVTYSAYTRWIFGGFGYLTGTFRSRFRYCNHLVLLSCEGITQLNHLLC